VNFSNLLTADLGAIGLDAAVKGVALLALCFAAVHCMKRRSAAARHLALVLAIGGLLVLPLLSWALPRVDVLPRWMSIKPAVALSYQDPSVGDWLTIKRTTGTSQPKRNTFEPITSVATPRDSRPITPGGLSTPARPQRWSISEWALLVWIAGVVCALAPTVAGLASLWRLQRISRAVQSGPLLEILKQLQATLDYRRRVRLLTTAHRRMPMMWGAVRPTILLPEEAARWPEERQRLVLLHELAHVQRHDFLTLLVTRLACALHWFNPLAWMAARQISLEQDQACDDIVLAKGTAPASYAEEVLQFASGRKILPFEALSAVAMARPSSLEGRLLAILDVTRNRTSPTRRGILVTVLLGALVIIPMSMLRAAQSVSHRTPRPDGLVAWWRGDGDGKDSAGDHDGTFPFGERYVRGLVGGAFNFLRSHSIEHQLQRVSIPDSPDFELSETFTLEAWICPVEYGGIVLLRGDDRGGYDTWQVDLMTDKHISFVFNSTDNQGVGISAPIQLRQWQHIAAVFDRGTMNLYINGILAAQKKTDLRPIAVLDKGANPTIGIGNAGGKYYSMPFNGGIDEVRIYNRALSETEIDQRMRN
jgi:beta-lactamase regulating signal transducer with metallopeptidase domain